MAKLISMRPFVHVATADIIRDILEREEASARRREIADNCERRRKQSVLQNRVQAQLQTIANGERSARDAYKELERHRNIGGRELPTRAYKHIKAAVRAMPKGKSA
jgi:hypothetical protein